MTMVDPKAFGARLTARIAKFRSNPTEFARRLGIGQSQIQRLCAGQAEKTKYIKKIAEALYTSSDWLYYGEGPEDCFPQNFRNEVLAELVQADNIQLLLAKQVIQGIEQPRQSLPKAKYPLLG